MKRSLRRVLSFFFITLTFLVNTTPFAAATPIQASLAPMLQNVLPAVVNIRAQIKVTDFNTLREIQKQRKGGQDETGDQTLPNTFVSVGSGVIVDAKNGYILTNAHVITDAQSVTVTLGDSRHYNAKMIGVDKPSDVALLQITAKNLSAAPIGDSNKLKVGDFVAAIGNPFGLNQTVTSGIVSALGRTTLGIENYENFIQTDAPINPGNSGGALMDMQGQLIGLNTAILAPNQGSVGIGFAIPANMAKSVMNQLIQFGNVKRGMLGIGVQDVTPELASAFTLSTTNGAAVTQVLSNSPGQQAGLQVGDIITAINGSEIKNASDVVNTVGFLRVDSTTNIDVLRNNKQVRVTVTLSDPSKRKHTIEQSDPFLYGVGLKNFGALSPVHGNVEGVMVISVEEDSNSWHADLRPGDVITSVNQQKVKNIDELKAATAKADKILLLNVLRGMGAVFLVINKES
jgi:serine protease Do